MFSSTLKGMLLAAANVFAVAFVIGAVELWDGYVRGDMLFVIALLGLGPGLGVGAISGYIAGELPALRRSTLCGIAVASVVGLGIMTDPDLILRALPSTVILTLVLERWSRPNLAATLAMRPPKPPGTPVSPVWLGLWLGMANAIVITLVFALTSTNYSRYDLGGLPILVGCLGILPGAGIGAALGCFTTALHDARPALRVLLIGVLALLAVAIFLSIPVSEMIGTHHDPLTLIPPAMVPTMIAVLILERSTRPTERVPAARALA